MSSSRWVAHDGLMRRVLTASVISITLLAAPLSPVLLSAANATTPQASHTAVFRAETPSAEARIAVKLQKRLVNARLGRNTSVLVMDATDNRVLFARQADKSMLPASNMKIVTAVNALAALGPDTRFTTRVVQAGSPNALVIIGGGDPLLRKAEVRAMARTVVATFDATQPVVLNYDDSRFGDGGDGPGWTSSYTPGIVAPVRALGMLGEYANDTAKNVAQAFVNELARAGINAAVGARMAADPAWPVVAETSTHTVGEAVRAMLLVSENNIAEVLYRQVAIAVGQPGTWAGGEAAATAQLAALGIDTTGLQLKDGSGVSRKDRLTALSLANLVRLTRSGDPARFSAMYEAGGMPTSGSSGTLDDRYGRFTTKRSRCAAGAVRAKTGTLFDTIALSGVTTGSDSREKVFSVLVNDRPRKFSQLSTRQAVDGLIATITGCW